VYVAFSFVTLCTTHTSIAVRSNFVPRLFEYHCDAEVGSKQSETVKMTARQLLRAIINRAMIATWALSGSLTIAVIRR